MLSRSATAPGVGGLAYGFAEGLVAFDVHTEGGLAGFELLQMFFVLRAEQVQKLSAEPMDFLCVLLHDLHYIFQLDCEVFDLGGVFHVDVPALFLGPVQIPVHLLVCIYA